MGPIMPRFNYTGRGSGGQMVKGEIIAFSADAVVEQLLNQQIQPLQIKEVAEKGGSGDLNSGNIMPQWPTDDDVILFTRQMYTLSKSGVPMVRALQGLIDATHNLKLVEAIKALLADLQSGRDLSSAMGQHPKIFNALYIRIVRIGEDTGRLDEAFNRLHHYLEVEKSTRQMIKSALRYPTFVMIAMVIAVFILNFFVIPAFTNVFKKMGADLPWATQVLLATSSFTVKYAGFIVAGAVGAVFGFNAWTRSASGKLIWDRYKLKLPLAGSIINRATLARFSRAFAMSAKSGLPTVATLNAAMEAVDNAYVAKKVEEMRNGIERGGSITQTAYASQMFTPLVLQMMAVGEETGSMADMMEEVADFYEKEVEYEVKALGSAIEPILLVFMGAMVLILALGIFLPMWDLGSTMMKKK